MTNKKITLIEESNIFFFIFIYLMVDYFVNVDGSSLILNEIITY